jgi:uncharacterized membrane protein YphA (DoxX/SURF4 family)
MNESISEMKLIRTLSRIITGIVFIFSGTVKAIDPLGSAYKFHDYFHAFGLGFLDRLSLILAVLLCTTEFIAGFSVLTGVRQKTGIRLVMLFMIVFTPLTFILAIKNPVSDCGCFGDALHLTNWQTFWKNVVLLAAVIVLYAGMKNIRQVLRSSYEWIIFSSATVIIVLFSLYNLRYLPVIDFLPYKTGVRIADKMVIPEGVPSDVYETTFIYEKDGVKKEFDLKNYPANDSTWKFVDQKSVLLRKGYQPPIHDFSITGPDGDDLTQQILSEKGYTVLMITKKLKEASSIDLYFGFDLGRFCKAKGITFYVITASGSSETKDTGNELTICSADETTLKTMIRSNPGYILLRDGIIKGKWSHAGCPDKEWFGNLVR